MLCYLNLASWLYYQIDVGFPRALAKFCTQSQLLGTNNNISQLERILVQSIALGSQYKWSLDS